MRRHHPRQRLARPQEGDRRSHYRAHHRPLQRVVLFAGPGHHSHCTRLNRHRPGHRGHHPAHPRGHHSHCRARRSTQCVQHGWSAPDRHSHRLWGAPRRHRHRPHHLRRRWECPDRRPEPGKPTRSIPPLGIAATSSANPQAKLYTGSRCEMGSRVILFLKT